MAALLVSVLAIGAYSAAAATNAVEKPIGEVAFSKGKASIVSTSGVERAAAVKTAIFRNERISCGAGGRLEIRFSDDSVVLLGENSEIVVDEYVYAPVQKENLSCVMRLFKGACRIVTGAITKLNPDRFKVHTRMATIGVRGCELGIRCQPGSSDVYVIGLGKGETVVVETTSNGKPLMNIENGRKLPVDAATLKVVNVDRTGVVVSTVEGRGFLQRSFEPGEIDALAKDTSHMPVARYESIHSPGWSIIRLRPSEAEPREKDGGAK